jgi:tetratricopeptide (TPR) repeat protein
VSLCLASAGVVKSLSVAAFMLAWTHSIEKIEWQEDWRVTPQGLEIVEARVKGSGAGMEPPPEALLKDGWFHWKPHLPVLPEVVLGNSGLAGEWRFCNDGKCQELSAILGRPVGTSVTTMSVCKRDDLEQEDPRLHKGDRAALSVMASKSVPANNVLALLVRARNSRSTGNFDDAWRDADDALRLDPRNVEAFTVRGDALVGLRRYDRAIDDYDAAIRLNPHDARLFSLRALAFASMREARLAIRDYTEAIRLDPRRVQSFVDRAAIYKKVRRYDLALDDQSAAILLDPASADLFDDRGETYARNNAYDRAIDDYNEAIRLKPSAKFYLNRGAAYQLKDNMDAALADYNKAIELDGKLALAYNNRGTVLRAKGNRPRALADFTTAARLDPDLDIAVAHRKDLAREIERLGAHLPLKGKGAAK